MELDTCLKYRGDHYEHISVYADDLLIASKDNKGLVENLTNKHKFKLKCAGPMPCHLGCDFGQDDDGTIHFAHRKCIEKMIYCHVKMFRSKPKLNFMSPS